MKKWRSTRRLRNEQANERPSDWIGTKARHHLVGVLFVY
jgi:hypothetical protein